MSDVILTHREQEELYVLLKPREDTMAAPLEGLLVKIEQALFQRLTIEEIEELAARFGSGR
jgi:hypothetical protein